jgi:hypothetical protein
MRVKCYNLFIPTRDAYKECRMKQYGIGVLLSCIVVGNVAGMQEIYFGFEDLPCAMYVAKNFFSEGAYPKRVVPTCDPANDIDASDFSYDSPRWLYYVAANNPQFYLLDVIQTNKEYYLAMVSNHRDAVIQELESLDEGSISQEYVRWLRDKMCRSGLSAFFAVLLGTAAYQTYYSTASYSLARMMVAKFAATLGVAAAIKTVSYWISMTNYRQKLLDWYARDMDLLDTLEQI